MHVSPEERLSELVPFSGLYRWYERTSSYEMGDYSPLDILEGALLAGEYASLAAMCLPYIEQVINNII